MRVTISARQAKSIADGWVGSLHPINNSGAYYWSRHIEYRIREEALQKKFTIRHQFQALYSIDVRFNDFTEKMRRGKEILREVIRYGEWLGYHIRLIDESNDWQPYIIIDWS